MWLHGAWRAQTLGLSASTTQTLKFWVLKALSDSGVSNIYWASVIQVSMFDTYIKVFVFHSLGLSWFWVDSILSFSNPTDVRINSTLWMKENLVVHLIWGIHWICLIAYEFYYQNTKDCNHRSDTIWWKPPFFNSKDFS